MPCAIHSSQPLRLIVPSPPTPAAPEDRSIVDAASQILDALGRVDAKVDEIGKQVAVMNVSAAIVSTKQDATEKVLAALQSRVDELEEENRARELSIVKITAWAAGCAGAVSAFAWTIGFLLKFGGR